MCMWVGVGGFKVDIKGDRRHCGEVERGRGICREVCRRSWLGRFELKFCLTQNTKPLTSVTIFIFLLVTLVTNAVTTNKQEILGDLD